MLSSYRGVDDNPTHRTGAADPPPRRSRSLALTRPHWNVRSDVRKMPFHDTRLLQPTWKDCGAMRSMLGKVTTVASLAIGSSSGSSQPGGEGGGAEFSYTLPLYLNNV